MADRLAKISAALTALDLGLYINNWVASRALDLEVEKTQKEIAARVVNRAQGGRDVCDLSVS
jgi:hypothetical protein